MDKNPHIAALNQVGQSVWYDNLSRDVLHSGELASLIAAGVSGLTSNPSIFKKAIADTGSYDEDIRTLARKSATTEELCEELMLKDVAAAADLLRPIYDRSDGADGYASVEVSPFLAHDSENTIVAARRIWEKLSRPNIMIKIPATPECLGAIRACLSAGINVNITLIFSTEMYSKVATAYIEAMEERLEAEQALSRISSVASFFVSRVDTICEKTLAVLVKEGKVPQSAHMTFDGRLGIANSKLAYAEFGRLFGSESFTRLAAKGARVQRPLWASTSTKNPALSPLLYIEELAGKDTVNTLPPATLKTLMNGATIEPRLHSGLSDAQRIVSGIGELGVPFERLLVELRSEGVQLFSVAYQELLSSIDRKKGSISPA